MNLPFSPTFFRKIDIFQQLKEYESQKDEKHLWEGEKAVLIWSASDQHQHLGSSLDAHHVKNALDYCVQKKFMIGSEKERLQGSARHILDSLPVHEFGTLENSSDPKQPRVTINRNGILAGEILIKTKGLINTREYEKWKWDWYLLYWLTGLLLVVQVMKGFWELFIESRF